MPNYWVSFWRVSEKERFISASRNIGVTNNLVRRIYEHREGLAEGFTKRYDVKRLVYYERHDTAMIAIQREKKHKALVARMEDRSH